jgi:hypothetical protein
MRRIPVPDTYDLKSVNLPRFSGGILKFFTEALESPITRWLLINNLLQQGGIISLRDQQVDEPPTFLPPVPCSFQQASAEQKTNILISLAEIKSDRQNGFSFNTIMDYAAAYRNRSTTPEIVAERILAAIEESQMRKPSMTYLLPGKRMT